MRERASGGRAAIFLSGEAREEFASGEAASEFNSTLHQSSHGFATRVHGFATKTKALTHQTPPATQAIIEFASRFSEVYWLAERKRD